MTGVRLEPSADRCLDDIFDYTLARWGEQQARAYVQELFEEFAAIADKRVLSRPIAAELEVEGFCRRWRRHVIYWKMAGDGGIAIFAILHERMHQTARLHAMVDGDPG